MKYLGKHTTIAYLSQKEWKTIPYLKDNKGLLPPFIIAVGDARRAIRACKVLGLKDIVLLHKAGEKLLGLTGRGRVSMVIGNYIYNNKKVPLLIVETQMGMSSTEIILREVVSHCDNKRGIYIIRVGTAGGINNKDGSGVKLEVGDITNASFSIGWSGALIESMAGLDYSSKQVIKKFRQKWIKSGNSFTKDKRFPLAKQSPDLVRAIDAAARELDLKIHKGGNFSKDSLYAELDTKAFMELRRKYNVLSSEMEQMVLAQLGPKVHTGLVSGLIGILPGASFAVATKAKTEANALQVAALALWHIAWGKK